jgi:3'-phosphoadenosine 5'-phosphosulfate sulfotransferase (PAPS reductase)/FAD synthetase
MPSDDDTLILKDPKEIQLFMDADRAFDCMEVEEPELPPSGPKSDRTEGDLPAPEQDLVVATSGGKDSAAMALWLKFESGLPNPMRFVFSDTGHEHPITLGYLDTLAEKIGQEIEWVEARYTFQSLAEKKQRFPSKMARFCTQELKVFPMQRWIAEEQFADPVLCQGVRAEESARRSKMPMWDDTLGDFGGFYDIWRPILRWSVEQVFAIHKRHGLEPNPLYKMGAGRVGCWPCIYVRLGELANAFRRDPDLLPRLEAMEAAVAQASKRGAASFFGPDKIPSWAHDKIDLKTGATYPSIRAVHDYVLQPDQGDLFAHEGELTDVPTCMSQYGLCE